MHFLVSLLPLLATSPALSRAAPSHGLTIQCPPTSIFQDSEPSDFALRLKDVMDQVGTEGFNLDLNEMRLVKFVDGEEPVWMTEGDKIEVKAAGLKFMDITDNPTLGLSNFLSPPPKYSYTAPKSNSTISEYLQTQIFPQFSTTEMRKNLEKFTTFRTRYYRSSTGRDSQLWLLAKVEEYARANPSVSVKEFEHYWGQNSIVARFEVDGLSQKEGNELPITIIGAHQDSTHMFPFLPAPGADDDGSGTTSNLEAFRILAAMNYTPTAGPVEFHWYSAEEGGLLGSQAIAKSYASQNLKIKSVLHLDMTGFVKKGTEEKIGIITDFVDKDLSDYLFKVVETYCDIPAAPTKCGYACSDHASWSEAGFQASCALESLFDDSNQDIHSGRDTVELINFDHMLQFSKLAAGLAVEQGGMVKD